MTSLGDALKAAGLPKITIVEGGIYRLRDDVIHFPDSDEDTRTKHDFRTVLVLSNKKIIDSYYCPCVIVAPMSHSTSSRSLADMIIEKDKTNNLSKDKQRIMFGHMQPVMKGDLEKQIGVLSEEDWQKVMAKIVFCFDH